MKKPLILWAGTAATVLLCVVFAMVFVTYAQPMEDRMYDPSIVAQNTDSIAALSDGASAWTVFVQTGEEVRQLQMTGNALYGPLDYPGQTFYFSRVMVEKMDAATLQLGTVDRNFAVFLDGELLYTDCPEQDNRIGYLTLPHHGKDRQKNVTVSLPADYVGKRLTIAQSTSEYAETQRMLLNPIPCSVKLYCDFAYESTLISESFQTAVFGAAGYVMGLVMLALFLVTLLRGQGDAGFFFLALTLLLNMTAEMYNNSYAVKYFGTTDVLNTVFNFSQLLSVPLLIFLATRTVRFRIVTWLLTGLYAATQAMYFMWAPKYIFAGTIQHYLLNTLPETILLIALIAILVMSWLQRSHSGFHRVFSPVTTIAIVLWLLVQLVLPTRTEYFMQLLNRLATLTFFPIANELSTLMIAVSVVIVLVQFVRGELERYSEEKLLLARSEMTRQSYENLRLHNEEVMIIRHDMKRHFQYLRSIAEEEKVSQYLDSLIGQNEKIRPVFQSGNEMLDIIIGSRAAMAADQGITLDVVRADAPAKLPVEEADLCSMMMNLLDNALSAARDSGQEKPVIRLDLHIKSDFFVFVCVNPMKPHPMQPQKEETVPKHGLGLKIVRQIAEKYSILLQMGQTENGYKVEMAIPLDQPSK